MSVPVYVALLHYPVVNRHGEVVTTAVTNLDLHDIARSARTYDCAGYFIVTPIIDQHALLARILAHWQSPSQREYHPDRFEALSRVQVVNDFAAVKSAIAARHEQAPEVILTDASPHHVSVSFADLRRELGSPERKGRPLLIVLGTGWGMSDVFLPEVDRVLAPIYGPGGHGRYNHLSVRAAAAVILDRLLGI